MFTFPQPVSELNRVTWGVLGVTNSHIMFPGSVSQSVQAYSPCLNDIKMENCLVKKFFPWAVLGQILQREADFMPIVLTVKVKDTDSEGWKEEDEGNSHSLSREGECEQQAGLPRWLTQPFSFSRSHTPPVWSINHVTVVPQMECFIRD